MPRQSRSGGGSRPSRPMAPSRPAPAPQQTRSASTAAYPPARTQAAPPAAPAQQQQGSAGPGLFGQMASTAAGVAVGSSIGHAIGGFFGGGSSQAVEQPQDNNAVAAQAQNSQSNWGARNCEVDAKQFTQCMDEHQGNMQVCGWYLEQLKACQQAAKQY